MRRSEITPELIELSKRAKELGFPQNVEEGDWVAINIPESGWLVELFDATWAISINGGNIFRLWEDGSYEEYFLILEFSRCLEWLREHKDYDVVTVDPNENPHTEIAEAVVKMLGEEANADRA